MSNLIQALEKEQLRTDLSKLEIGDTVRVFVKVVEGTRERLQAFEGIVIKIQGGGIRTSFTVRRISYGIGVERTFPMHSPVSAASKWFATAVSAGRSSITCAAVPAKLPRFANGSPAKIKQMRLKGLVKQSLLLYTTLSGSGPMRLSRACRCKELCYYSPSCIQGPVKLPPVSGLRIRTVLRRGFAERMSASRTGDRQAFEALRLLLAEGSREIRDSNFSPGGIHADTVVSRTYDQSTPDDERES